MELNLYTALLAALLVNLVIYLLTLLCTRRYAFASSGLPADDEQRRISLAGLLSAIRSSVRWGTLAAWLNVALCCAGWLMGAAPQQAEALEALHLCAYVLLGCTVLCHGLRTLALSRLPGVTRQQAFNRAASLLPIHLLICCVLSFLIHGYLSLA